MKCSKVFFYRMDVVKFTWINDDLMRDRIKLDCEIKYDIFKFFLLQNS